MERKEFSTLSYYGSPRMCYKKFNYLYRLESSSGSVGTDSFSFELSGESIYILYNFC